MKKTLITSLFLSVCLLSAAAAQAAQCTCIGASNTIGAACTSPSADFLTLNSNATAVQIGQYSRNADFRRAYENTGKAYDNKTGWACKQ